MTNGSGRSDDDNNYCADVDGVQDASSDLDMADTRSKHGIQHLGMDQCFTEHYKAKNGKGISETDKGFISA